MTSIPMARLDAIGAALNFRNPICASFILKEAKMFLDFCYIGFHARNFLILLKLAGTLLPEAITSFQNPKIAPPRSISVKGDRQLDKGAMPALSRCPQGRLGSLPNRRIQGKSLAVNGESTTRSSTKDSPVPWQSLSRTEMA